MCITVPYRTVPYGTCTSSSSYSVEASITYAMFTDLAGEFYIWKYQKSMYVLICKLMELVQVGRDENVAAATAKLEIRCGLFAVSPQVNNACS